MAVAAHWEASAATGINGNQNDNSIPQAGAVYVFTRTGTDLDAAGVRQGVEHRQGRARRRPRRRRSVRLPLALSGDGNTLAVGAITEDGVAQ